MEKEKQEGSGDPESSPRKPKPQPVKNTAGPGGDDVEQQKEHGGTGSRQRQPNQQHQGRGRPSGGDPTKPLAWCRPQQPPQGRGGSSGGDPPKPLAWCRPQRPPQGRGGGSSGGDPPKPLAWCRPQQPPQGRGGSSGGDPPKPLAWCRPQQPPQGRGGGSSGGDPPKPLAWCRPQQPPQGRGGTSGGDPPKPLAWCRPQQPPQGRGGGSSGGDPPKPLAWCRPQQPPQGRGGTSGGDPPKPLAWCRPQQPPQGRGRTPGGDPPKPLAWSRPQEPHQDRAGPSGANPQQPGAQRISPQQSRCGTPHQTQQPRDLGVRKELPVLSRAVSKMKIDEFKPSNIPVQAGSWGKKISIEANYLDLNIKNLPTESWQYDVVIEPDKPKKFLRLAFNEFIKLQEKRNIFLAFDGNKIAFSKKRLEADLLGGAHEIQIIEPDTQKAKKYKVTIKEADCPLVELSSLRNYKNDRIFDKPMRAVQCLDVVLRSAPADANFAVRSGRNFYVKPKIYVDLGDGYELWLGLFQACVLGDRPLLNVDVCHKAFPSEVNLIDFIRSSKPRQGRGRTPEENVLSLIKGIDVSYQEIGNPTAKRFKCSGLGQVPARQMFERDGKQISVRDYFARDKNITLQHSDLPCVMVSQGRVALPMEFCKIPGGQAINKKAGDKQVSEMIKSAATTTDVRKTKIMDLFRMFKHDMHPIIRNFEITIGKDFLKLQARILDAPTLEYAENQTISPVKGSWQNKGSHKFIQPSNLINWAILICDRYVSEHDVQKFKNLMIEEGGRLNMKISKYVEIVKLVDHIENHLKKFKSAEKDLVLVVISEMRNSYSKVKQPAEIRCGVLTQCIKAKTIKERCTESTVHNILLKINAKLNGTNHKISEGNYENVMFLGADVTHPSPDQRNIPSVVGIVATHDRWGFQYNMRFRLQDPKQEMIQDMEILFKEHLLFYKERNKALPKRIVYYRDGVSDGQFEQVRQFELNAMERAVSQVQPGYKPLITCIICQKRHHTRFFPTTKTGEKFNNVPPGTVVDCMITHPAENQFFLVSHESVQGVCKPSKYCLIRDDSKFNIDEVQTMTYNLCHMFARCDRAVSYPAPAYYAHLAAARGRAYIEGVNCNLNNLDFENMQRNIKAQIFRDKPMFFV